MIRQGKSLLRITPTSWGPVATGGYPPRLAVLARGDAPVSPVKWLTGS